MAGDVDNSAGEAGDVFSHIHVVFTDIMAPVRQEMPVMYVFSHTINKH